MSKDMGVVSVIVRGHLVTLWLSVLRHAPDGNLSDWDARDIADYAEWDGDPQVFVDALIKHQWLVETGDHLEINDWRQYAEHLKSADRKAADRERKSIERAQEKARKTPIVSEDKQVLSENVQGQIWTAPEIHAEQNRTEQIGSGTDLERNRSGTDLKPLSSSPQSVSPDDAVVSNFENHQTGQIHEIFEHYRKYHPRAHPKPGSTSVEWKKIKARLDAGYSVDDLKQAIDGCHKSPWHCGENESGKVYQNLELIVRDGSKVNDFLELAKKYANGPPRVLSEKTQRNVRAAKSWLANHGVSQEEPNATG